MLDACQAYCRHAPPQLAEHQLFSQPLTFRWAISIERGLMPHENSTQLNPAELIEQLVGQAISLEALLAPVTCRRVKKALLLIHAAPQLDWNCETFAELFHLNADYFSRPFDCQNRFNILLEVR